VCTSLASLGPSRALPQFNFQKEFAMLLNSLSRKRSKVAITAAVAVGIVFLSAAPAMAVGQKTVNGYTGKSWQDSSCDDYLWLSPA
jgi:hypothetical protein